MFLISPKKLRLERIEKEVANGPFKQFFFWMNEREEDRNIDHDKKSSKHIMTMRKCVIQDPQAHIN